MHILVRSADLLQSSAIYLAIILMIRIVSIIYAYLRATLFHRCFLGMRKYIGRGSISISNSVFHSTRYNLLFYTQKRSLSSLVSPSVSVRLEVR